jgi:hypothetical protein
MDVRRVARTRKHLPLLSPPLRRVHIRLLPRWALVTARENPILELCVLYFYFLRHLDVMHHHAYLTLHVFVESKIIWLKIYFYYLARKVL